MMTPRPTSHPSARVLVLGAAFALVLPAACSTRGSVGTDSPQTSFAPPIGSADDAGDGEAGPVAMCPTTECPSGYATCPGDRFPCAANVWTDPYNCGECGHVCVGESPEQHSTMTCKEGKCLVVCEVGYDDCDGNPDNGCETPVLDNPINCGRCGTTCEQDCIKGQCGCSGGQTNCLYVGCTDLSTDPNNCGACGNQCPGNTITITSPNVREGCAGGKCGALKCASASADCDGDLAATTGNGCETDITTNENCGGCGVKCADGTTCTIINGQLMCACPAGEALCNTTGTTECVRLDTDVKNCGTCGFTCETDKTRTRDVSCQNGLCHMECHKGRSDCDGDPRNGCETNIFSDPNNCGACGARCPVFGQPCVDGKCAMAECPPGTTEAR